MKSIHFALSLCLVVVLLYAPMRPSVTAQDDDALRDRVLAAYDNALRYPSGRYATTSRETVTNAVTTADFVAVTENYISSSNSSTFVLTDEGRNVQSFISILRETKNTVAGEESSSRDITDLELRLVDNVLYQRAMVSLAENSELTVDAGWQILADPVTPEALDALEDDALEPFTEVSYSDFDITGESAGFQRNRELVATAVSFTSELVDLEGATVEVITMQIDTQVYLELLAEAFGVDMDDPILAVFQDAEIILTATLDADGNLIVASSSLTVDYTTDDLASLLNDSSLTGTFNYQNEILSETFYRQIGEDFALTEAPTDIVE